MPTLARLSPYRLPGLLLLVCACLLAATAGAQNSAPEDPRQARLSALEEELTRQELTAERVAAIQREAGDIRNDAESCERASDELIAELRQKQKILRDLTEIDPDDDPLAEAQEVSAQRESYQRQIDELGIQKSKCSLVHLRASEVEQQSLERLGEISTSHLLQQGLPASAVIARDSGALRDRLERIWNNVVRDPQLAGISRYNWAFLFFATILVYVLSQSVRAEIEKWATEQRGRGGEPSLAAVFVRNTSRWQPLLLASLTAAAAITDYTASPELDVVVVRLAWSAVVFALGAMTIDWLVGPYSPGAIFLRQASAAGLLRPRLRSLLVSVLAGFVAFGPRWLGEVQRNEALLLRLGIVLFIVTALIWLVRAARRLSAIRGRNLLIRLVLILGSLAALVAEMSGYRNLANHLLLAGLSTLAAALLLWILLWLLSEMVKVVVHGTSSASYRVRAWLGMRPDTPSPELGWLRLIFSTALWLTFLTFLIAAWDTTGNTIPRLSLILNEGIPLNEETTLRPRQILTGLLIFGLVIAATAWFKARLSKGWLRDMGMDRGSREALVTLAGYVGFIVAIGVGLALSGVDFAGLAIVVGALSVGIGFGLQNVVNNFVSGLILLFERPIKSGDFVSVGAVEGLVKNIRIRSTEIETLDRRTVIVPNSELVSNQVTNWVLHDPFGRLSVTVGVAYGSDTKKVKELLERAAQDHSEVLSKGPAPPPRALFMGFGDSSLDFELRVWIRQIEKRFQVTSDLNFAIDAAFREHNVEIPFPQRDLHLRSVNVQAAQGLSDSVDEAAADGDPKPGKPER